MSTLYENYNTGDDSFTLFYGAAWFAQSFTPSIAHKITSVKLKIKRIGSPGTLIVGIRATDGSGHPTGADLCSGTTNADNLPLHPAAYEWREITLGAGSNLDASTKYAIVARIAGGDTNNKMMWATDITSPTYTDGVLCASLDSGGSWSSGNDYDLLFEEYGDPTFIIYPDPDTEPLIRASGIKRSFWAGTGGQSVYQMELALGGMSITYISAIGGRDPTSAVAPTPLPSGLGYTQADYEAWLRQTDIMVMLKIFGHFPTYAEWLKWKQAGTIFP